ncbi:MAG: CapA family protein [Cyclobacteriaceae bacterium]
MSQKPLILFYQHLQIKRAFRPIKGVLLALLLVLVLYGCKVGKTSARKIVVIDTSAVEPSVVPMIQYLITQKGDTLQSLDEEVDIAIERLLPDTISIAAVGDIMMGTNYPSSSYLPSNNGKFLWSDSRDLLNGADLTFGNLEGTVLDGKGNPKKCKNPKACYLFRMPTSLTSNLVSCGFDLMSLANNHANDFGSIGRLSTQSNMDSLNISTAGSIEAPYTVVKKGGYKVGFVAFAPNKGTLGFYDIDRAIRIVKELSEQSDFVLVSIHGGAEGSKNQHVTRKTEFYYGENRGNIYSFSHQMIDNGADVILGHGPHVPRGIEVYNKRMIAYSLGNFCTYGRFNLKGPNSLAPLLITNINSKGEFLSGEIISFRQTYADGPKTDEFHAASKVIKKLSEEDFPENEIIIDEKGKIIYLQN